MSPRANKPDRAPKPADDRPRAVPPLGGLAALILALLFAFPSGAYPLQSLVLSALVTLAALAGVRRVCLSAAAWRPADWLLSPLVWGLLLSLYAAARWPASLVPAVGRDETLGYLWLAVALLAGVGLAGGAVADSSTNDAIGQSPASTLRRGLVIAALCFALHGIYQYFIAYPRALASLGPLPEGETADLVLSGIKHALKERRVGGRLGNPNLFAAQLCWLSVFCVAALGDSGRHRRWRWLGLAGWIAAAGAIVLTRSRGGLLTFGLASFLALGALLAGRRRGPAGPALALVAAALFLCIHEPARAATESLLERLTNTTTLRERLFYWEIAWNTWLRHPLLGAGPGGFEVLYLQFKSPLARESQHAHSWLMQSLADLGLVGAGLWLMFWTSLLALGRRIWRRRGAGPVNDGLWFVLAGLVIGANGLIEFSLAWREFLIALGFSVGLAAGAALPPRASRRFMPELAVVVPAALAVLLAVALTPAAHLADHYRFLAAASLDAREPARAVEYYDKALRWQPNDPGTLVAQAGALALSGAADRAWTALDRAEKLNPYSASIAMAKARWMLAAGQPLKALGHMDQAVRRYPTAAGHRLARAELLLRLARAGEARRDLEYIETQNLPLYDFERDQLADLQAALAASGM